LSAGADNQTTQPIECRQESKEGIVRTVLKLFVAAVIAAGLCLSQVQTAEAGWNDPWYLLYKMDRNSRLIHTKGPYDSKFACSAAKWKLPFGAVFIGCEQ